MLIFKISGLTVFTSGFDCRVFWITCTARWPAINCFLTSKSHIPPTTLQLLFWRMSLLRRFLVISFFVEISGLRNSVYLSRLVISFLSTIFWYSSWFYKLIFCFTPFCIRSLNRKHEIQRCYSEWILIVFFFLLSLN